MVRATDQAVDPTKRRWGSVTARLFVTDENDNAPVFSSPSAVSVMEDQPVGSVSFQKISKLTYCHDPELENYCSIWYNLCSVCLFTDRFVILYVVARDKDEGENGRVLYRIQAGNRDGRFSLNPNTGKTVLIVEQFHSSNLLMNNRAGFFHHVNLDYLGYRIVDSP